MIPNDAHGRTPLFSNTPCGNLLLVMLLQNICPKEHIISYCMDPIVRPWVFFSYFINIAARLADAYCMLLLLRSPRLLFCRGQEDPELGSAISRNFLGIRWYWHREFRFGLGGAISYFKMWMQCSHSYYKVLLRRLSSQRFCSYCYVILSLVAGFTIIFLHIKVGLIFWALKCLNKSVSSWSAKFCLSLRSRNPSSELT